MDPCTPAAPTEATHGQLLKPSLRLNGTAAPKLSPDSFLATLDPLQLRRHLAGRRAVERHADAEQSRRLYCSMQALMARLPEASL